LNPQSRFQRIGLFDSGVGGLSVLKELAHLPGQGERHFYYFGDTARCPYGNREPFEIKAFVTEIIQFLETKTIDAVVMACNTSAACALDAAREKSAAPVFDLISLTAEYVATFGKKVGVMATASTVKSGLFSKLIQTHDPSLEVFELACPDIVPIVESGDIDHPSTRDVLQQYARKLLEQQVEVLILGCTHFPFIRAQLEPFLGEHVMIVNPADVLREFFAAQIGSSDSQPVNHMQFFVSGNADAFTRAAEKTFGLLPGSVTHVPVASDTEGVLLARFTDIVAGADQSASHVVASPTTSQ
jgi:glutamate racemase